MKTRIKNLLIAAAAVVASALAAPAPAQELYRENETAMHVFRELDRMFPRHYLTNRNFTEAQYWVEYSFKDREEQMKWRQEIEELFRELDAAPAWHKYTSLKDSGSVLERAYKMSFPTGIAGQSDYLSLQYGKQGVFYYYQTNNTLADRKADPVPDQKILSECESLLNAYISRPETRKKQVRYYGHPGRAIYADSGNRWLGETKGYRYIVPGCGEADYRRFYELFHKYLKKDFIHVSANDVYWQYDEVGIRILRSDGRAVFMGAALKGEKLYLVRVETGENGRGTLPRAWAEGNWMWDDGYVERALRKGE